MNKKKLEKYLRDVATIKIDTIKYAKRRLTY